MKILSRIENKEALRNFGLDECTRALLQGVLAAKDHCLAEALRCVNGTNSEKATKLLIRASAYDDILNIKDELASQKEQN